MTTQTESTDAARRAAFARRLRAAATQAGSGPEAIPRGGDGPVRQSRAQHELWIQDHYLESNALYSVHQASMLHGPLDVAALSGAVEAVAARHDALRMSFPDESQVVVAGTRAPLDCLEVAGGTESERRQAGLDMLRAAIAEPFDLRAGPLMRALLLRLEPDRHLLLLNLHHSVTDGLSLGLLYQELSELYAAAVSGRAPKLAEDPLQYSDFCRWQARRGDPAASLDYWREALRNIEPILELPADRPRPAEQSHRGAVVSTRIEGRPAARLRQLAGQHGTTLATALLSAFAVVLHRRSGQRSFGVGSMVSGRIHPELDEVVGLFATTVVLGVDLREPADFATLLRRQHQVVTGAIAHQDVSFADVVEAVRPPREVSRNPLFQVLFQHESGLDADIELPGLEVEAVELDAGQAKVDLGLFTSDRGPDGIELHLSYASDLYDPLSAQAILDQVKRVTGAACDDPGCPIESLDLMPEQQRRSVVDGWNATEMDYPDSACVHELFERQVDAHPDAVAIRHGGTQVSYRELDRRANQIANRLLELGVRTESLVGLCIEHSVGMFAALLGILKAGAGYVPLDPEHPRDRLDYILQDTDARVALASRSASASLPEGITTILVDSPELALCSTERPAAPVSSENLVYAMYTSGSTGRPKGVLISHRGLVNYLWWSIDGYGLAGEHGAPMLGSIAFDLSIPNFLLPLIGGKDVSVLTEEDRSLAGLTDLLVQDQDFSLLKITPAHLDVLRGNLALREEPGAPVRSVRTYVVGADEVKAETVRAWSALAPGSRIINEYGPTETVVGCSVYEVPREHDLRQRVPIGRPIGNTTMYVLDPQLNPVPPGVVGELFIGGHGVARGYLNRPGLTASKFLPDPFSNQPGARFYRTGDLARFRGDGNLDFLGRQDHQVKIRGFRIELGEIETCLLQHADICEAVAATYTAAGREPRLFAYVVPHAGAAPQAGEIKAFLRRSLPDYLVPATITVTEAIPLSSGGKVDRRLLTPPAESLTADEDFVAPQGPLASALAEIWAELLGTSRVGAGDNFFDVGGDSILVIQLANRAKARGLRLSPRQVYRHQTLERIAATMSAAAPDEAARPPGSPEAGAVGEVPLTPSQRWLTEHPAGLARGHIASEYLSLPGWVSADLLAQVLTALQQHHEALRIRQRLDGDGRWSQRITAEAAAAVLAPDVVFDTAAEPAQILEVVERLGREIDIENGPLLRAALLREEDSGSRALVLSIHHLATDGLSWQVLLEDLRTGLEQLRQGRPLSLPPVDVPFSAWARQLAVLADSPQVRGELPLWARATVSASLPLDTEAPVASLAELPRATFTDVLDADRTAALGTRHEPGAHRGIGDLMLVTLAQLMAQWCGSDGITIEVSGHGRHHDLIEQDSSRTVGWLAARYPVSFSLPAGYGGSRASDAAVRVALLRQVAAVPDNGLGFGLLKYLNPDPAIRAQLAERAEPPVSFNYLGRYEDRPAEASRLLLEERYTNYGQPDQPDQLISLVAAQVGSQLQLAWTYRPALHTEATIAELARRYRELLRP